MFSCLRINNKNCNKKLISQEHFSSRDIYRVSICKRNKICVFEKFYDFSKLYSITSFSMDKLTLYVTSPKSIIFIDIF